MRQEYSSANKIKIKLLDKLPHFRIWNKRNYDMSNIGKSSGKNGNKKDCLTCFYIKQQILYNNLNTFTNYAPITSLPASLFVLS